MTLLELPDRLPVLSKGKQGPGTGKVCAEQAVNWLDSGHLDLGDETDHPSCVQPVLNSLAIAVNDALPDSRRGEMWPLILRQPGTAHPEMEPKLSTDLAVFVCRWVVSNWPVSPIDPITKEALEAAAECLAEPSEAKRARAAEAAEAAGAAWAAEAAGAAGAAGAAEAAWAAWAAGAAGAAGAAEAAEAAWAAWAARAAWAAGYLKLLADAQDECERLTGHIPTPVDIERLTRLCELVGAR